MRYLGEFILISILIGFAGPSGAAQEKPALGITLRSPALCWRTEAPAIADLELRWTGRQLLHGRLEAVVSDSFQSQVLARVQTGELTLATGAQTVPLLLPAAAPPVGDRLTIRFRFRTAARTFELGTMKLPLADVDVRTHVIASCTTGTGLGDRLERVARSLAPERLLRTGPAGAASVPNPSLATARVRLAPDDLPSSPLPLCAYDLLVADAAALAQARDAQLTALAAWIEAGGSFCLVADRLAGLRARHVAFLNRLAASTDRRFTLAPDGSVSMSATEGTWGTPPRRVSALLCRAELGRAVLVRRPVDGARFLTTPDGRRAAAFLWKIKHRYLERFVKGTRLSPVTVDPDPYDVEEPEGDEILDCQVQYLGALESFHWLLPADVRVIPFWLLSMILVGFVLVIGPGEFRLVRRLRRGWLTWLIFPMVCFGTAVLLVQLSRAFLGGDTRRALVVVDVGEGGRELRRTRLDLVFLARPEIDERALTGRLCAGMDPSRFFDGFEYGGGFRGRVSAAAGGGLEMTGDYPDRFSLRRRLEQWTPQITRTMAIGAGDRAAEIDWARADTAWRRSTSLAGIGRESGVIHVERYRRDQRNVVRSALRRDDRPAQDGTDLALLKTVADVVHAISVRPRRGLFAVVSQVSPTGGGCLEDLAMLDASDRRQGLLVVIAFQGEDIVVHRRLYREDAAADVSRTGADAEEER